MKFVYFLILYISFLFSQAGEGKKHETIALIILVTTVSHSNCTVNRLLLVEKPA